MSTNNLSENLLSPTTKNHPENEDDLDEYEIDMDEADKVVEAVVVGTSSSLSASFNFVNAIVGSGIIGLPFAVQQCGFVAGLVLLVLVALATDYSVRILINSGIKNDVRSYEALMEKLFGINGKYLISMLMFFLAYGAMISYLIIVGETIPDVFGLFADDDSLILDRRIVILIFGTGVILPLCLLKDMSNLSYTSFLSVIADFTIIVVVIVRGSSSDYGPKGDTPTKYTFIETSIFGGISTMGFAFVCHHSAFVIFSTLKRGTKKTWSRVSKNSVTIAFVLSFTLACFGYLIFLEDIQPNILENFAPDDNAINAARILLAVTMFFTFPMEQFVSRHVIHSIIFRTHVVSNWQHYGLTFILWSTAMAIAILTDDLDIVLELTGAISASTAGYILPVVVYFKTFGYHKIKKAAFQCCNKKSEFYQDTFRGKISAITSFTTPMTIGIVGVFVFILGTTTAILKSAGKDF